MNLKAVSLACVALGVLAVSFRWWAVDRGPDTLPDTTELKKVFSKGQGDGAKVAADAMVAFLKQWNPVGRTAAELKTVFGRPSLERSEAIVYMFDTGLYGWIYQFELEAGKVVRLPGFALRDQVDHTVQFKDLAVGLESP